MTPLAGQTISHYKILDKLGEGGMGVVYRAEDLKLTRTVALKFLPHGLDTHEPERARFLQEARAAAILNHPNICTVHDIQEHEGQPFIVMECVEGKTLREMIPLKNMQDAIGLAIQIGEALQEAHSHGIVHRDIKAENIMVNSKGQAKVMDFGLAKLKGSLKLTKATSTVGTLAYMAPEQIQGGDVDARSDIFSFGVLLYEMLTGHFPFHAEHEAAMLYSILNEEPEPLTTYMPDAPSELSHVFDRAVEKSPEDRYQSMADAVIDLRRLKRHTTKVVRVPHPGAAGYEPAAAPATSAAGEPPVLKSAQPYAPAGKSFWKRTPVLIGSSVVILLVAALLAVLLTQRGSRGPSGTMITRVLKTPPTANHPNISQDGNWVVFIAEDAKRIPGLYITHITGGDPKRVTEDTSYVFVQSPCFSPDASQIVYERYEYVPKREQGLYTVSALGGASHKIVDNATLPVWSPDGKHIAYFRTHPQNAGCDLLVAGSDGKGERRLASLTGPDYITPPGWFYNLAWSPDSKKIAYLESFLTPARERYTEIFVRGLEDTARRQITSDKKVIDDFCWISTGEFVFNSTRGGNLNLWMMPETGGNARQLTLGGGGDRFPRSSRDASHLVYVNESETSNLWTLDLGTNQVQQLTFEDALMYRPAVSSDGRRLAYWQTSNYEAVQAGIRIAGRDGSDAMKLNATVAGYDFSSAVWSRTGAFPIVNAFRRDTVRKAPDSLVVRDAFFEVDPSSGAAVKLGEGWLFDASRDGKYLLCRQNEEKNYNRGYLALSSAPDKPLKFVISPYSYPVFSWDSKSVVVSDSTGIQFVPVDEGKAVRLIKCPREFGVLHPLPDGKSILGLKFNSVLKSSKFAKLDITSGRLEEIAPLPPNSSVWGMYSTLSPDGKTLVFSKSETRNRIMVLDNFR